MKSQEEIENRLEKLEKRAYEHNVGAGDVPPGIQAEISALKWVLED